MSNQSSNNANLKDLTTFLSTEEGMKEGAKILPSLIVASVGQIEDSISQLSQQSILTADSMEQNFNATNANTDAIQEIRENQKAIMSALGMAGIKTQSQESVGQVSPTPTAQPQSDLDSLSQFVKNARSMGQSQNNQ